MSRCLQKESIIKGEGKPGHEYLGECADKQESVLLAIVPNPGEKTLLPILEKYVEKGGLTIDDFTENCLICFDDIDELDNSKEGGHLKARIQKLMNQVLQVSRSKNITVVNTTHVCLGGADTKVLLNAMNSFTFFIASVSSQIKNCLKTYVGLNKEQIQKILNLQDTRWVTIFLTSPMVVLTQKEIFILK